MGILEHLVDGRVGWWEPTLGLSDDGVGPGMDLVLVGGSLHLLNLRVVHEVEKLLAVEVPGVMYHGLMVLIGICADPTRMLRGSHEDGDDLVLVRLEVPL